MKITSKEIIFDKNTYTYDNEFGDGYLNILSAFASPIASALESLSADVKCDDPFHTAFYSGGKRYTIKIRRKGNHPNTQVGIYLNNKEVERGDVKEIADDFLESIRLTKEEFLKENEGSLSDRIKKEVEFSESMVNEALRLAVKKEVKVLSRKNK